MIKTPFRYPGGKAKMIKIILPFIDQIMNGSDKFCDAFVGGGSVLLAIAEKYPKAQLFCNDKDYGISSFWKIISDKDNSKLFELFQLMGAHPTLELFYKLRGSPSMTDVEAAYQSLFFNRCCFSGIKASGPIGGKKQDKYTVDCRYNFKKLKSKILNCHQLLAGRTQVDNKNFSDYDILSKTNYPAYIDPPYLIKGDQLYSEKMNNDDHITLANILNIRSNWVLSYDDTPVIRDLYKNKLIVDFGARYSINGSKITWQNKNELIILA